VHHSGIKRETINMITCNLFVDGKHRPASDGATSEVRSPHDQRVIAVVARATLGDIEAAVSGAQAAFKSWSALPSYEREKITRKATAFARTKADEIGRLMALEQGKPLAQSRSEVVGSCDTIDYYAAEGPRVEGWTNPTESREFRSTVIYQPLGVCALITPWNYPVSLLSWKLGPAIASGCAMVVKPTSVTPLSPTAFCAALIEGGLPAGLIQVVNGSGSTVGEALARNPLVVKLAMTGSTAVGKRLMAVGAPLLKKISLELGGQCPAIVCADADIEVAAKVLTYKGFRNMGQSCSSVNRVYVHASRHDELVQRLKAIGEGMTLGDGITDPNVDLGPMAQQSGVATVKEHIADALEKGATLVTGGGAPAGEAFAKGNYFLPTVLTGCTNAMRIMREETFGPVIPVSVFQELGEAISAANDSSYGLVSYLFTRDYRTTVLAAEALESGTVCVNNGAVNTNYAPYSGWKDSGFGTELSRKAMFEYLKIKHIKTAI
jgi:succinate-semialdehyde dehydrogenase / glutarate-semialdehyde dehydrogenase